MCIYMGHELSTTCMQTRDTLQQDTSQENIIIVAWDQGFPSSGAQAKGFPGLTVHAPPHASTCKRSGESARKPERVHVREWLRSSCSAAGCCLVAVHRCGDRDVSGGGPGCVSRTPSPSPVHACGCGGVCPGGSTHPLSGGHTWMCLLTLMRAHTHTQTLMHTRHTHTHIHT